VSRDSPLDPAFARSTYQQQQPASGPCRRLRQLRSSRHDTGATGRGLHLQSMWQEGFLYPKTQQQTATSSLQSTRPWSRRSASSRLGAESRTLLRDGQAYEYQTFHGTCAMAPKAQWTTASHSSWGSTQSTCLFRCESMWSRPVQTSLISQAHLKNCCASTDRGSLSEAMIVRLENVCARLSRG